MEQNFSSLANACTIIIKSAGEMASGIAVRLYKAGFTRLVFLETDCPLAVRRSVAFSEAVFEGSQVVEDIRARRVSGLQDIGPAWAEGVLPLLVDPKWTLIPLLRPQVTLDALIAKRNVGTRLDEAPLVLALGPGFVAGQDAHCVIETQRGHDLGRLYYQGSAAPNTGIPGEIGGQSLRRVLRAPCEGIMHSSCQIGERIEEGQIVCRVEGQEVPAALSGVLRGCLRNGVRVRQGAKLGDIDPRGKLEYCFSVSEKARALGGAVLEAVCANSARFA